MGSVNPLSASAAGGSLDDAVDDPNSETEDERSGRIHSIIEKLSEYVAENSRNADMVPRAWLHDMQFLGRASEARSLGGAKWTSQGGRTEILEEPK